MKILPTLVCALLISPAAFAQEYEVVFHRNYKAGDKEMVQLKFSMEDDQQFAVNGTPTPTSKRVKLEMNLSALNECVAADKNGYITEGKMSVKSCECTKDGVFTVLFKNGDEIGIKEGKPMQYTVNGSPALGLQRTVLGELIKSSGDEPGADDLVFGPGRKVKVGETWPINADAGATSLTKKMGAPVSKDALSGTVKLESVDTKNGVPCLRISAQMQLKLGGIPLPGAPPEIKTKTFDTSFTLGVDLPVDPKLHDPGESTEMKLNADGGGKVEKNGQSAEITFQMTRSQKKESTSSPAP